MTSMSSVATAGSVSGSRLVTQNLLLGLDSGWMTGLWTVRAQRHGARANVECNGDARWPKNGAGQGHLQAWEDPPIASLASTATKSCPWAFIHPS